MIWQAVTVIEAHFKTLKYQPDYPGLFTGLLHARAWLEPFFEWHNDEHHHCGFALFTPAGVFFDRVLAVHAVRQETLDTAYALHPGRFPNGPPQASMPPAQVHINPLEAIVVSIDKVALADTDAIAPKSLMTPHATVSTPHRNTLTAATTASTS